MVHGFKPGKHVKKLYSYRRISTNPWFQTMILHEVIVSNHINYFKTITLSSNSLFQTMKAKHKSWFPNHEPIYSIEAQHESQTELFCSFSEFENRLKPT
jgi:hypothetical protein